MKHVWAIFDNGDVLVHEGKPCIFTSRKEAREFKVTNGLSGSVAKLANVAIAKKESKPNLEVKPKTYVVMLLDKSSSMYGIKNEARSHFNEQVDTIKKETQGQDVSVIFVSFNQNVDTIIWDKDVVKLEHLVNYEPFGSTALCDAIGMTVERMEKELPDINDKHVSVLFSVVTDGYENTSKKYTQWNVKDMIERLKKTDRWTFTFLGATHDFLSQATALGIDVGNISYFSADKKGMVNATVRSSVGTASFLRSRKLGETKTTGYYSATEHLNESTKKENQSDLSTGDSSKR